MTPSLQGLWQACARDAEGPIYDSGISSGAPASQVRRVLFVLSLDVGTALLAKAWDADAVVCHHSVGRQYYEAHRQVMARKNRLEASGFSVRGLEEILNVESASCRAQMRSGDSVSALSVLNSHSIACISAHSVGDAIIEDEVEEVVFSSASLGEAVEGLRGLTCGLETIPPEECVTPVHDAGEPFSKPYVDIAAVSPPGARLLEAICKDGCDLIVTTALPTAFAVRSRSVSAIELNHIAFDALSLMRLEAVVNRAFPAVETWCLPTGERPGLEYTRKGPRGSPAPAMMPSADVLSSTSSESSTNHGSR